uniref:Uncharacterized protein n=1 Tax=Aegilops tauschii subsp. strangulata TaxID=200361 RepID=A0A453MJN9_AEGTS
MVTEEALPTYQKMLNILDGGVRDETGSSPTSWAVWTRAWTAEENRHGDLMNKYIYLTGRADMRQVEKTIQYLVGAGMYTSLLSLPCVVPTCRIQKPRPTPMSFSFTHLSKRGQHSYLTATLQGTPGSTGT